MTGLHGRAKGAVVLGHCIGCSVGSHVDPAGTECAPLSGSELADSLERGLQANVVADEGDRTQGAFIEACGGDPPEHETGGCQRRPCRSLPPVQMPLAEGVGRSCERPVCTSSPARSEGCAQPRQDVVTSQQRQRLAVRRQLHAEPYRGIAAECSDESAGRNAAGLLGRHDVLITCGGQDACGPAGVGGQSSCCGVDQLGTERSRHGGREREGHERRHDASAASPSTWRSVQGV